MAGKSGVLVGAMLALGLLATPALAAETTVNCANLQSALSGAKAGDKITLSELCKSGFPYKLPAVQMTLAGTPGAGFDGGTNTVQLEGSGGAPTIEGLIFENAHSTAANSGGALTLNGAPEGSTVTLAHDTFTNDVATGGEGGGARINTASAAVTVSDSTFSSNSTTGAGGALTVFATSANLQQRQVQRQLGHRALGRAAGLCRRSRSEARPRYRPRASQATRRTPRAAEPC